MPTSLMPEANQRYYNNDGTLAAGCLLYTYAAGTTTPKATYTDSAGLVPHANPIVLDAKGEAVIYWDGSYKVDLKTAAGVQITNYPVDNYTPPTDTLRTALAASTGTNLIGFSHANSYTSGTLGAKAKDTVSIKDAPYNAVADGVTAGQQAAFLSALSAVSAGGVVELPPGTYIWSASATVNKAVTIRGNGATIKFDADYDVTGGTLEAFSVTANDVVFEGIAFDATGAPSPSSNSRFIWSTAARTVVRHCTAKALPDGTSNVQVAFGSSAASSEFTVMNCRFDDCPGAGFSQGARPMFLGNRVTAPKDVSFALNSTACAGGMVVGNNIYNNNLTVSGHILAEEGASYWLFANNYVYGVKDGIGIGAVSVAVTTVVEGGIIENNIIDGAGFTSTDPASLVSISQYYNYTQIRNNKLLRMPAGLASNTAITAPFRGTRIEGNKIDGTTGTSSAQAISLTVVNAGNDVYLFDNDIDVTGGPSRHVLTSSGDNGTGKLYVRGGRFIGGTEGVNFNLNAPTNISLWVENIDEISATNPFAVSTALAAWGDRQTYFNTYDADKWPHSIKDRTVMYGNAIPTTGTWSTGDEVIYLAPSASNPDRARCVSGGTPGTWKASANLAA